MAVNVVSFSFSRCSTGGPEAHSAGWWLSLLHLISNFSGPQTPSGFPRAPSAGRGFPYHISSIAPSDLSPQLQLIRGSKSPFGLMWLSLPHLIYNSVRSLTATAWLLSWLSYMIVQRPLSRLLDLWNRMFDRHQAEITVMQFTGHSLPVHLSKSVPWEFFLPRAISSVNFRPRDFLS